MVWVEQEEGVLGVLEEIADAVPAGGQARADEEFLRGTLTVHPRPHFGRHTAGRTARPRVTTSLVPIGDAGWPSADASLLPRRPTTGYPADCLELTPLGSP